MKKRNMFDLDMGFGFSLVDESEKNKIGVTDDLLGNILDVGFPVDVEGEPSKPTKKHMREYPSKKIDKAIRNRIKKHNQIIHGARAINKQVSKKYRRKTDDYDTWAKNPGFHADVLEDELDKIAGCDMFYEVKVTVSPDVRTGKSKDIYRVMSRKTKDSVVDYMKRCPTAKHKKIGGFQYETLGHAKKTKEMILEMCENEFFCPFDEKRVAKTKKDLNRIKRYEKSKKKKKKKKKKTKN